MKIAHCQGFSWYFASPWLSTNLYYNFTIDFWIVNFSRRFFGENGCSQRCGGSVEVPFGNILSCEMKFPFFVLFVLSRFPVVLSRPNGMVVALSGQKGETRAARNRFRQRHFTARRPCFPLSLIRGHAPFRERSEQNPQRTGTTQAL